MSAGEPRGRDRSLRSAAAVPQTRRARGPQIPRPAHHAASPPHRNAPARRPRCRARRGRSPLLRLRPTRLSATRGPCVATEASPRWIQARCAYRAAASSEATRSNLRVASREDHGNARGARRVFMKRWIAAIAYREPRIALRPDSFSSCAPWIHLTDTWSMSAQEPGRAECRSRRACDAALTTGDYESRALTTTINRVLTERHYVSYYLGILALKFLRP